MSAPIKGEDSEQASKKVDAGESTGEPTPERSRARAIVSVIAAEFAAPLLILTIVALSILGVFNPPPDGYRVGALRVLPFSAQATQVLFVDRGGNVALDQEVLDLRVDGVVFFELNGFGEDRFESFAPVRSWSALDQRTLVFTRLGDVVRVGTVGNVAMYRGVIFDPRIRFQRHAEKPDQQQISTSTLVRPTYAQEFTPKKIEPNKTIEKDIPGERTTDVSRGSKGIGIAETQPLQDSGLAPESIEIATSELSNEEIVTSAVMLALLRADAARLSRVLFVAKPSTYLGTGDPSKPTISVFLTGERLVHALGEGLRRVAGRLVAVDTVIFAVDIFDPTTGDDLAPLQESGVAAALRAIWGWIATPLPWPGGDAFLAPVRIDGPIKDAEPASLINPAYATPARATAIPSLIFLMLWLLALVRRIGGQPTGEIRPRVPGIQAGLGSAAVLAFLLYGLRHLSPLLSATSLAGAGDLALVGATFGAAAGAAGLAGFGVGAFVRRVDRFWPPEQEDEEADPNAPRPGEPKRDNVLRSILYSDNPIESLDDDRLGFAPVVEALHRFLDNKDTKPPVVIAVNGPWGSGKTSIMKMLATRLRKTDRFHVAWFNAWQYHREEQILAAFLKTVAGQLKSDWGLTFKLRLARERIKRASFKQIFVLLTPPALLVVGLGWPELLGPLYELLGEADDKDMISKAQKAASGTLSLAGTGGLLWLSRFLWPFQLQFKKLSAVRDPSARIGFIDEFREEFELYRDALGEDQKFLIIIDDLDRCLDRNIVDVLKTINLIVSGDRGASRTFFLLGYDPNQVIPSVELHFQDLLKARKEMLKGSDDGNDRFGESFMKKIVTLSVSVPHPKPETAATALADRLDPAQDPSPRKKWLARAAGWLRENGNWLTNLALAVVAMLVIVIALQFAGGPQTQGQPDPSGKPPIEGNLPGEGVVPPPAPVGEPARIIALPADPAPDSPAVSWLLWIFGGVLILAAVMAFTRRIATPTPPEAFLRPTEDSQKFKQAIEDCGALMPGNPRDIVRLMNLMRLTHLVQEHDPKGETYRGTSLNEWESVTFTLLQQRHPAAFTPTILQNEVIAQAKELQPGSSTAAFFEDLGTTYSPLAKDIATLTDTNRPMGHLVDSEKLLRFHDVNYYELAIGERLGRKRDDTETDTDGATTQEGDAEDAKEKEDAQPDTSTGSEAAE